MKTMCWLLGASVAVLFSGCAQDDAKLRLYDNNDLELATVFAAKMTCSCRFVMQMDEAYCRDWVRVTPDIARFTVDETNKTVTSSAFISWTAKARYVDDKRGCVAE
jgi:hypothetical protein